MNSALIRASVFHKRMAPKTHEFSYKLTSWLFNVDDLAALNRWWPLTGYNRAALFSVRDTDYGFGANELIADWIKNVITDSLMEAPARVELLTHPRCLGISFNPLSVWYCYNSNDELYCLIYEVRNTFGQRHHYLIPLDSGEGLLRHHADKEFYVSPFMEKSGEYIFQTRRPDQKISLSIEYLHQGTAMLLATWHGKLEPLTLSCIIKASLTQPFTSLKILSAIHWQALKLWIKGLRLTARPDYKPRQITRGYPANPTGQEITR